MQLSPQHARDQATDALHGVRRELAQPWARRDRVRERRVSVPLRPEYTTASQADNLSAGGPRTGPAPLGERQQADQRDRKSTRLNSSHLGISYAVFCLKKKKQ